MVTAAMVTAATTTPTAAARRRPARDVAKSVRFELDTCAIDSVQIVETDSKTSILVLNLAASVRLIQMLTSDGKGSKLGYKKTLEGGHFGRLRAATQLRFRFASPGAASAAFIEIIKARDSHLLDLLGLDSTRVANEASTGEPPAQHDRAAYCATLKNRQARAARCVRPASGVRGDQKDDAPYYGKTFDEGTWTWKDPDADWTPTHPQQGESGTCIDCTLKVFLNDDASTSRSMGRRAVGGRQEGRGRRVHRDRWRRDELAPDAEASTTTA